MKKTGLVVISASILLQVVVLGLSACLILGKGDQGQASQEELVHLMLHVTSGSMEISNFECTRDAQQREAAFQRFKTAFDGAMKNIDALDKLETQDERRSKSVKNVRLLLGKGNDIILGLHDVISQRSGFGMGQMVVLFSGMMKLNQLGNKLIEELGVLSEPTASSRGHIELVWAVVAASTVSLILLGSILAKQA